MKLKYRLAFAMVLSTVGALALCFLAVYGLVLSDEIRDLDSALMAQAEMAAMASTPRDGGDPVAVDGTAMLPEAYATSPSYVAIYDAKGQVASATQTFEGPPPPLAQLGVRGPVPARGVSVDFEQAGVRLRGVVIPVGTHGHVLLFASHRDAIDRDTAFLLKTLSALFVAAVIVAALVATWLGHRLTRDVDGIAMVATSVAKGDLNARVTERRWGSVETRALATSLNHMIEQLAELVEGQRVFISHAAHELRSPLATMRGELQLALRRPRESAEYQQTCEEVLVQAESLSRLADDLLTLTRIQRAEPPRGATAKVRGIVEDAIRMSRGIAEQRGVTLEEPSRDAPVMEMEVRGMQTDLARALRNLVDNAVAHSPLGGRVHVLVGKGGEHIRFSVIDQGPGVDRADKSKIFQAFYRGSQEQAGDQEGTGLGLAIARGIARSCDGDLMLDLDFGLGAKFDMVLPHCERADTGPESGGGPAQRAQ